MVSSALKLQLEAQLCVLKKKSKCNLFYFTLILLLLFLMEEKFQRNCADSVKVAQTRSECTVLNTSIHHVVVGMTYLHGDL